MPYFIRIYHLSIFLRWYQLLKLLSVLLLLSHRSVDYLIGFYLFTNTFTNIYGYKKRSSTA